MEALTERREAVEGWEVRETRFPGITVHAAIPPSSRHYLPGMTPGSLSDGTFAYLFLRKDVAEATIARDARIRGAEA